MNDELRLQILLPMDPIEESDDVTNLLQAFVRPAAARIERLFVYRPLELEYFVPEEYFSLPELHQLNEEGVTEARAKAEAGSEKIRGAGYDLVSEVLIGSPRIELERSEERLDVDLTIIRTSSEDTRPLHLGSLTSALMHHGTTPLLTHRSVADGYTIRRVVAATDLSPHSKAAADWASALAQALGAELHLLYVLVPHRWGPAKATHQLNDAGEKQLKAWLEAARPYLTAHSDAHVKLARSVDEGVNEFCTSHEIDLVVITCTGRSAALSALVGSDARKITRNSNRPVLVIPMGNRVDPRDFAARLTSPS